MNFTKTLGVTASILGLMVFMVAVYLSFSSGNLVFEPFLLGIAAVLVGLLCVKKSRDS